MSAFDFHINRWCNVFKVLKKIKLLNIWWQAIQFLGTTMTWESIGSAGKIGSMG